jgi:hypothetical protein
VLVPREQVRPYAGLNMRDMRGWRYHRRDPWRHVFNGNGLSGTIPSSIGELTGLASMGLLKNRMSGKIPSSIGELTGLAYM